jgi:hypothetical protein
MSLGIFGLILLALIGVMCIDPRTRGRIVFTALVGLMLGLVIAGSDGVLVNPSHALVDGVRAGLSAIGASIGGGK